MKKIAIITNTNPTKSYSGIKYLAEVLADNGISVDIYGKIPKEQMFETKSWKVNINSFYEIWVGKIPYIRRFFIAIYVFYIFLKYKNIIIHELYFFRQLVLAKKLFKNKRFFHYATELYTNKDEPAHKGLLNFYRKYANIPDAIIECDLLRLEERAKLFGTLPEKKLVIPNTLPSSEFNQTEADEEIIKTFALATANNYKTIVYTGAAYLHRELDRFIDAVHASKTKVFVVCIVYGSLSDISKLQKYAESKLNSESFRIFANKPRNVILGSIGKANAGFVYYRPSLTVGNRLASPTKFYEYIALGIPVICSNNDTLKPLVENMNLGVCVEDETISAIANAIDLIFDERGAISQNSREACLSAYKNYLSYEVSSKEAVINLLSMLESQR